MKPVNWIKKAAAVTLSLGMMVCAVSTAGAYGGPALTAPRAENVVIDGNLEEWDLTRGIKISAESQIIDQIEHWDGEEDCSAELYAMWDEENLYLAVDIKDDTPFVYREGFPLDELDAVIFFLSTNPDADPQRTSYETRDWRIVTSVEDYYGDWFNFVDRSMVEEKGGYETRGEYGDELVFDDMEAAFVRTETGAIYEIKLPLHNLSNDEIAQLVPADGMILGFDFSILDVDLPCPGIHSLRMQASADLNGRDRKPEQHDVDKNPSLWGTISFVEE